MKRIIRLMVNVLAVAMLFATCMGLVGCANDKVQVELKLAIYNSETHANEDATLTVTLHRDLATETVDAIVSYIEEGYYNDAIFYGLDDNKIMVGDLKMGADGKIYQNTVKPTLKPEFENGAVKGSDLKVESGSIALWRSWSVKDGYSTSASMDTGRATFFLPTTNLTSYDGWFCVFATIDLEDATNKEAIDGLKSAVLTNSQTYEVYYTLADGAEYDAEKDEENNGLTFNCAEEVPEGVEPFEPEGEQYECYKQHQIKLAKGAGNTCGAKIVSAKII